MSWRYYDYVIEHFRIVQGVVRRMHFNQEVSYYHALACLVHQ